MNILSYSSLLLFLSVSMSVAAEPHKPSWYEFNPDIPSSSISFYETIHSNADEYVKLDDVAAMGICFAYLRLGNPPQRLRNDILFGLVERRWELAESVNVPAAVIQEAVSRMEYFMLGQHAVINGGFEGEFSVQIGGSKIAGPDGYCARIYGQLPDD